MRKTYLTLILICFSFSFVFGQRFADQVPQIKRYTKEEATDPVKGIVMYNKLIPAIKGDSIRYNKAGYNLQGWQEDYYSNGKVLHKGFYVDGQIKVFKNFYENGQVERSFVASDPLRCSLDIFYPDGKVRNQVIYYDGNAQKEYDFFPNGNPRNVLETDKDKEFVFKQSSYFENGQQASTLELTDKKTKKYNKKEFYENGKVKEEGEVFYGKDNKYQKEGEWFYYDEKGGVTKKERYKLGQKL
jgi:antitoxin component YwqK of YwqJK toxin-antitoxin module